MKSENFNLAAIVTVQDQMVAIPGGAIKLRDDRIKHTWTVALAPFFLAKIPVTQDLYYAVTQEAPSFFKDDNRPVETVSWQDAVTFCNLLSAKASLQPCYDGSTSGTEIISDSKANGYRLPTEVEWEYACKAGTTAARYGELEKIAWYKDNSRGMTQPVGEKEPNAWGLYGMLGNVWEWCSDIYDATAYGLYRLFRGGGWFDEARGCLATNVDVAIRTCLKLMTWDFE